MAEVTVVYWRDFPAQVIVGRGRSAKKIELSLKFTRAIDRCAMKSGATGDADYLADWRRGNPYEVEGNAEDVASGEAARLETEFTRDVLDMLIENDGWMTSRS
jgi:hypothetical protein